MLCEIIVEQIYYFTCTDMIFSRHKKALRSPKGPSEESKYALQKVVFTARICSSKGVPHDC